jgi:dihydroxycyclohexadiene carboxylate dehydrogenase
MNISGRFNGKVMAVTGAAQGIGWRVAERAAAEGARLILIDRSSDIHEQAVALVTQGHSAIAVQADLESYAEAEGALAEGHAAYARIDILINNVGGTIWAKPFAHYAEAEIEAEVRRSLFPTLWCCRAVLPYMLDAGGGTIVNVSSVATRGIHRVPYAAAKVGSTHSRRAWRWNTPNLAFVLWRRHPAAPMRRRAGFHATLSRRPRRSGAGINASWIKR